MHILFHILFHYGLSLDIGYSPLCYTVGPCCLCILYVMVCICQPQTPNLSFPHTPREAAIFQCVQSWYIIYSLKGLKISLLSTNTKVY